MKTVLAYYNETFMRLSVTGYQSEPMDQEFAKLSPSTQEVLGSSMLYSEDTKMWGNPYTKSDSVKLKFLKNKSEFLERKWVLLKKDTSSIEKKYIQDGPYSSQEIFEMLRDSILSLTDGVWKTGFTKWTPLKKTLTFKELDKNLESLEPDVAEILSNVIEYDPEMHRVEKKSSSPEDSSEVFVILDDK